MDQRLLQQALRPPLPDRLRELRRGDGKAPFLEELHRDAAGRAAAPATDREVDALIVEIDAAMVDLEQDAQVRDRPPPSRRSRGISHRLHTEGGALTAHHGGATRLGPAVGGVGDQREGFLRPLQQALPLGRQRDAARPALEDAQCPASARASPPAG